MPYSYTVEFQAEATPPSFVVRISRDDGSKLDPLVIKNSDATKDDIDNAAMDKIMADQDAQANADQIAQEKAAELAPIIEKANLVLNQYTDAQVTVTDEDIAARKIAPSPVEKLPPEALDATGIQ